MKHTGLTERLIQFLYKMDLIEAMLALSLNETDMFWEWLYFWQVYRIDFRKTLGWLSNTRYDKIRMLMLASFYKEKPLICG